LNSTGEPVLSSLLLPGMLFHRFYGPAVAPDDRITQYLLIFIYYYQSMHLVSYPIASISAVDIYRLHLLS
jgi:hypothetical protein